jgi:hypothetical protein
MLIVGSHAFMVRWRIMVCEVVTHVGVTMCPTYNELVLFHPVFNPIEYHVHGFGAFLLD